MKVSLVIPCHNAAPYVAQTVRSALGQTRPPDEIIVVDDGSTDGSREIVAALGNGVRVISRQNGSAARTRLAGFAECTGDAIMFLDADDVLAPDALVALVAALEREPGIVAACPWFRLEQEDGRWLRRPASCARRLPGEDPLRAWLRDWYHPPCAVLWSRAAYEASGGWNPDLTVNDDGELMMSALARGVSLRLTESGAAYYRRLPQGQLSLSGARFTRDGLKSRLAVIVNVARILEDQGRLDAYRTALGYAFRRLAADAREREPELARQCGKLRAQFGDPAWQYLLRRGGRRVRARFRAIRHRPGPAPTRVDEAPIEITHGLETRSTATLTRVTPASAKTGKAVRVSVIIPTFNRAYVLPRALDSVLAQSFTDFEVLVIDDGSTDNTQALVAGYVRRDPRVRYLSQPRNGGVSAARNRGFREARGALIALLDSDDEWLPGKLERQTAFFAHAPETVGLLFGGVETVGDRDWIFKPEHRGDLYATLLERNVIHGTSGVVMCREAVERTGYFSEELPAIEDWDYWIRVAREFEVDFLPEPMIRYYAPVNDPIRKSLNTRENLDARDLLYESHRDEMRRLGVADRFLAESARRHLRADEASEAAKRAVQAVCLRPLTKPHYKLLARVMIVQVRAMLRGRRSSMRRQTSMPAAPKFLTPESAGERTQPPASLRH